METVSNRRFNRDIVECKEDNRSGIRKNRDRF